MVDTTFTALMWVGIFCAAPMTVQPEGKCSDGSEPHRIELRLLEGKGAAEKPFDTDWDKVTFGRLFVVIRDGEEIVSVPNMLSEEEKKWLLQFVLPVK